VDGVVYDPDVTCPFEICEVLPAQYMLGNIHEHCKTHFCNKMTAHGPKSRENALLQLYDEWRVGVWLREHRSEYDVAIAISSDIWLPENFPIDQILEAANKPKAVYTPNFRDFGGITNGIMFGHPEPIFSVLIRYEDLLPTATTNVTLHFHPPNYEKILYLRAEALGIERKLIRSYQGALDAGFDKARHSGNHKISIMSIITAKKKAGRWKKEYGGEYSQYVDCMAKVRKSFTAKALRHPYRLVTRR